MGSVGRHVFDMTDGWEGKPPAGVAHMVVVTHRPKPEGWDPTALSDRGTARAVSGTPPAPAPPP